MTLTPEQEKRFRFAHAYQTQQEAAKKEIRAADYTEEEVESLEAQIDAANNIQILKEGDYTPDPVPESHKEWWNKQNPIQKSMHTLNDMAGGLIKGGVFDLVDLPANLMNLGEYGLVKAGMKDLYTPETPISQTKYVKPVTDALTARSVPEGVSPLNDALRASSEWGGGISIPAVKLLSKASKVPVKELLSQFNKLTKSDQMAALGAGLGSYASDMLDIPYLEQLLGFGFGVGTSFKNAIDTEALLKTKRLSPDKIDERAVQVYADSVGGPEELTKVLRKVQKGLDAGDEGTLADLAHHKGIYSVEHAAAKRPESPLGEFIEKAQKKRTEKVVEDAGKILTKGGKGAGDDLAAAAKAQTEGRLNRAVAAAEKRAKQAQKTLDDVTLEQTARMDDAAAAQSRLEGEMIMDADQTRLDIENLEGVDLTPESVKNADRVSKHSKDLTESFVEGRKAESAAEAAVWGEFKKGPPVDLKNETRQMLDEFKLENIYEQQRMKVFEKQFKDEMAVIRSWEQDLAEPTAVQWAVESLNDAASRAYQNAKDSGTTVLAGKLAEKVKKMLLDAPGGGTYRQARAATKGKYDKYPRKIVKDLRKGDPETFGEKLKFDGTQGAVTAKRLKNTGDESIIESGKDMLRSLAKREGLNPSFMSKYDEFLAEFPDLQAEFAQKVAGDAEIGSKISAVKTAAAQNKAVKGEALTQAKNAQRDAARTIDKAEKATDRTVKDLTKRVGLVQSKQAKTAVGRYAADPKKFMSNTLKKADVASLDDLKSVRDYAEKTGNLNGLKEQAAEALEDYVFPPTGGLPQATYISIDKFNKVKDNLVKSGIMTPAEGSRYSATLERVRAIMERSDAVSPVQIHQTLTQLEKSMASAASVVGVSALPSKHTLIIAGRIRKAAEDIMLANKDNPGVILRIEEFAMNPRTFVELASKSKTVDKAVNSFKMRVLKGATKTGIKAAKGTARYRQPYSLEAAPFTLDEEQEAE